jgi:hypothetical protein
VEAQRQEKQEASSLPATTDIDHKRKKKQIATNMTK